MSKQGKAIATINLAFECAQEIVRANAQVMTGFKPIAALIIEQVKARCIFRSTILSRTPQQHFNAKGKIDKRKVRRHDRKQGLKPHMIRIVRGK